MSGQVVAARTFALTAHGEQRYGALPYVVHLDAVADLVAGYGETAVVVAYLHDVAEDTAVSLQEIREQFGMLVATCVGLLTDLPGATRAERKALTHAKLAVVDGIEELALVVKAADRLANVRACFQDANTIKWATYHGEHAAFKKAAYRDGLCDTFWAELDQLLAAGSFTEAANPGDAKLR